MSFIGIRVPTECGRLLSGIDIPGNKQTTSEYHITLLCFEEKLPISEIASALEVAYDIISKAKPFTVKTQKISCFPKRGDNPVAIIAKLESNELHDLRGKLAKEFDKCNIDYSKIFKDFKPHITLSYNENEIDDFEIEEVEFQVQELVLWGGDQGDDRVFVTFPLKTPEVKKNALLMQKIDMFYKLAV